MSPVTGISAATSVYAIIGNPVRHSLSPAMQTAAFGEMGLDGCYVAFQVEQRDLEAALAGAAKLGLAGLNITVPHKQQALELADEADVTARLTGAANTLIPCNNGWKAYNTDVAGFVGAVRGNLDFDPSGRHVAILGAGGAARAAVVGMARAGAAKILVANRSHDKAVALAKELGGDCPVEAVCVEELLQDLGDGDLLVSATPLGLKPGATWPWELSAAPKTLKVYDMAYAKGPTGLETQARQAGLQSASGREMLLLQGAEAFRLWTGLAPPLDVMRRALEQPL